MRKLTIIRGKRGCGKTTEMIKMIEGKNSLILDTSNIKSSYFLSQITDDTDVVVIEECSNACLTIVIKEIFHFDIITADRKYKTRIRVKTPDFIIVMQSI